MTAAEAVEDAGWGQLAAEPAALKEWAALVRGLETGACPLLLRKGGIHERGFDVKTPRFLLFPTYLHQARDKMRAGHEALFDATDPDGPGEEAVRVTAAAEVFETLSTTDEATLGPLAALTPMSDEALALRYRWKPGQALHVLVVRCRKLVTPLEVPVVKAYGGCRSWITLQDAPGSLEFEDPVLDDAALRGWVERVRGALGG